MKIGERLPNLGMVLAEYTTDVHGSLASTDAVLPAELLYDVARSAASTASQFEAVLFLYDKSANPLRWPPLQSVLTNDSLDRVVHLLLPHSLLMEAETTKALSADLQAAGCRVVIHQLPELGQVETLPDKFRNRAALFDGDLLIVEPPPLVGQPPSIEVSTSSVGSLSPQIEALCAANPSGSPALNEPMILSAPVARQLAPVLCAGGAMDPANCSWYHGIWQYLRLLNVVSTPTWHSNFYNKAFANIAKETEEPSVLVSGTADYSLPAYVLDGLENAQAIVADMCEMPLLLSRWYATAMGKTVRTIQSDIRKLEGDFDVITADAFLTRFHPAERSDLLAAWARLLNEGGRIVTTVRIDPQVQNGVLKATETEISDFMARVERRVVPWLPFIDLSRDEVVRMAGVYARKMISHSFQSSDEMRASFEEAGLAITDVEIADVPGEMHSSKYARLVAQRSGPG